MQISIRARYKSVLIPSMTSPYASLSRDELIARLEALEPSKAGPSTLLKPSKRKLKSLKSATTPFQFSSHPTRHVALLIAYNGWPYSGLALQNPVPNSSTSDPEIITVESELMKALEKTKLIAEGEGWEGCSYSRCGRTDRGVSGEGQVVNLWVRSNRKENDGGIPLDDSWQPPRSPPIPKIPTTDEPIPPKSAPSEYPYTRLLNSILPPTIRILAWSPVPPDFSSRFSCTYRHYKYAIHLKPSPTTPPLSLARMREAASNLIGEHDLRNL
jgi:tRNA pseudouridine38/39 synthase